MAELFELINGKDNAGGMGNTTFERLLRTIEMIKGVGITFGYGFDEAAELISNLIDPEGGADEESEKDVLDESDRSDRKASTGDIISFNEASNTWTSGPFRGGPLKDWNSSAFYGPISFA